MTKPHNPKPRQKAPAKACGNCAHVIKTDDMQGYCRRYPPSLKIDGNSSAYVPVKLEWLCGEWSK